MPSSSHLCSAVSGTLQIQDTKPAQKKRACEQEIREAMAAKLQKQQQPGWCDGAGEAFFLMGEVRMNDSQLSRRHVNLVSLVSLFCLHGISRGRFGGGWGIGGVGGGRNLPHGSRELRLQTKVSSCCLKKNCLRTARQSDWIRFLSDRIDYLHYLSHI